MTGRELRRAVFLDRDGVINATQLRDGKQRAPDSVADFRFLPGVPEAISRLRSAGFLLIVVTNQPDVARGWQTLERVHEINAHVHSVLQVDAIEVCFHVDADACACRKPKPGMLLAAGNRLGVDFTRSFMVGDRYGDLLAGKAAGCRSILIGPGDGPSVVTELELAAVADARYASLADAVDYIISM